LCNDFSEADGGAREVPVEIAVFQA
jgi:hypothetical protein